MSLTELIARAPWREAVTYRDTWPHEYVLTEKDDQQELLAAVCERFRAGEGVACRFFSMPNTYLFIGDHKYWLMTHWDKLEPGVNYALNRARLYRDRRDFVIQPGDTGMPEDYPTTPARHVRTAREAWMADGDTLVAYLVQKYASGRVEDAATDGLAYILNKSDGAMQALDDLLGEGGFGIESIARVRTQVVDKDGNYPDVTGYDKNNVKRLLVESKFEAAFSERQVSGYARQFFDQPGPAVLLIIGPEVRRQTLRAEAKRQIGELGTLETIDSLTGVYRARVNWTEPSDSQLHLMIVSWVGLLNCMATYAGDSPAGEDIRQLRGLAQRQDEEVFMPIQPEELGADRARRMVWYNQLVDDAVLARGVPEEWMDNKGLHTGGGKNGYTRYFRFSGVDPAFGLGVNYNLWARNGDTPLWLGLYYDHWSKVNMHAVGGELNLPVVEADSFRWVPIHIKTGVEYDAVLDDVAAQLRAIGEVVREGLA